MEAAGPHKTILIATMAPAVNSFTGGMPSPPGFRVLNAASAGQTLAILEKEPVDVVFLDFEAMPRQEIDLVNYIKTQSPRTEIIVLATIHELPEAARALKTGASFYLVKPVNIADMAIILNKLSQEADHRQEYMVMEQRLLNDLMAGSPAMQKVLRLAVKIAPTASTVLLGGESGTGKEFFARIIHRMSGRTEGAFVAVDCGGVPDTLFESELFGHRKGAFTGADRDRAGLVEEARLGTLFLDEVGELSASAQVKLLRFLQERTFRRVGDNVQRPVNVRIIAASNRDLARAVAENRFREDLFYRLNVFLLQLPPLRQRKETIPNLIKLFLHKNNDELDKNITGISPAAQAVLADYDYPGNVRELENIIEHAAVLADGDEITEKDLPEFMFRNRLLLEGPQGRPGARGPSGGIVFLKDLERDYIRRALELTGNNYSEAAARLGVSRSTLWRKIREYGIEAAKAAG